MAIVWAYSLTVSLQGKFIQMALAFNNLRRGKKYQLRNHGELYEFWVVEMLESEDFLLKDVLTLEHYKLHDLLRYGKGKDYDLQEL